MDLHEIFQEHYRSLVRFLYRRIGDLARAEDLAQEAFVRALEHQPARPRAWLFAVAANLARDESRRSSVRRHHLALVRTQPRPIEKGPEHVIEQRERARRVRAALSQLSERDRETLLLWQEGLSYEEIGRVVGLARKSIGTTLARARGRLAAAYEALGSKGSDRDVAS